MARCALNCDLSSFSAAFHVPRSFAGFFFFSSRLSFLFSTNPTPVRPTVSLFVVFLSDSPFFFFRFFNPPFYHSLALSVRFPFSSLLRVRAASIPSPRFSRPVLRSHYLRLSLRALIWPAGVQLLASFSLQFFHALHDRRGKEEKILIKRRDTTFHFLLFLPCRGRPFTHPKPPSVHFPFLYFSANSFHVAPLRRSNVSPCLFPNGRAEDLARRNRSGVRFKLGNRVDACLFVLALRIIRKENEREGEREREKRRLKIYVGMSGECGVTGSSRLRERGAIKVGG